MTDGAGGNERLRRWLRAALAAIAILVLVLVVPPLISVNHYKSQITNLISRSLGRPVRLSAVQAHILPWPGFEISDLSVAEDPAYGAEPVLHANTVTASIRLLALFRGRVEIGKISVDEASLNLVRSTPGHWNLDSIFRTAAAQTQSSPGVPRATPLPYLEATDSRINFKNGAEKLPFSLVNADLSLWQENPGEWRVRLRGQPARTDVSLYLEETGEVRVEASVKRAAALSQMPLHLDVDWREAQLGQLARLITGSDPGWRGDLTGEVHLDGTAEAAQIAMRLQAVGVHRAEFTPVSPLDFDARCALVFHYAEQSFENLACDSPLGDGHVHITGEKPGGGSTPRFTVELDQIPVTAGLDALRTLRSGLAQDLEATGTVSGKIAYDASAPVSAGPDKTGPGAKSGRNQAAKNSEEEEGPLTGSLTVAGLVLSGDSLSRPIQAPKFTLEPVAMNSTQPPAQAQPGTPATENMAQALAGSVAIQAGGTVPLTLNLRFSPTGYQVAAHGQASFARAREIAQATGIPGTEALAAFAGEPISVDLTAEGPWIPADEIELESALPGEPTAANGAEPAAENLSDATRKDTLTGTVTVHNANWQAQYLAAHVAIDAATLHIENRDLRWDPVDFTYGPLEGSGSLALPSCAPEQTLQHPCPAEFEIQFDNLDASSLQGALLGARQKGTLLSDLIDRLHPATAPPWPQLEGTVTVGSLALGPVILENVAASLRIVPTGAEVTSLDAGIFGGTVHVTGALTKPASDQDQPDYKFDGDFEKVNVTQLGQLLGVRWTGGDLSGNGTVELKGYTDADLASSAKGALHFECKQGSISKAKVDLAGDAGDMTAIPVALAHYDRWTADATIANGGVQLGENMAIAGAKKRPVEATITFGDPPRLNFPVPKPARTPKRK
ncbi:MAG TPA: AsmA family protein [Terracidiphilus sp.]|nr:AsmA family protein [Terracidiphilus sp.]